ncbi:MAG TPA: RNB domain-containing ribonuclease [Jatrophihabitans sp.]|jgi:exoribonuclease R
MSSHRVAGVPLDFAALRSELAVAGDFASDVLAEADRAAASVELPDLDATDLPLVTVDPAGSRDLDQAVHIAVEGDGYLVSYAIADTAAFVAAGSPIDREANRRGETLYFPDLRVPLHPPVLSENAASLLPDQVRPAVLWRITLDDVGEVRGVDLRRARVRSRAQLDYGTVQRDPAVADAVALLPEVGRLRFALARERHAINLDLPAQEVEHDGDGWQLRARAPLPVESWNAEISLLTGMCAARLMLDHGHGILRTVPPPHPDAIRALCRAAAALGVDWPAGTAPGDVLARLDRTDPRHIVLIEHATVLLRGAAYTVVDGAAPAVYSHAGIGAPYTHVTAPLRRLVDRYASELCLALHAGTPVPAWVDWALPSLPGTMRAGDQRAHAADRAVVDMTEAWLLHERVGELFDVLVIDADDDGAAVTLDVPAVRAHCQGAHLEVGSRIRAELVRADIATRSVLFTAAS